MSHQAVTALIVQDNEVDNPVATGPGGLLPEPNAESRRRSAVTCYIFNRDNEPADNIQRAIAVYLIRVMQDKDATGQAWRCWLASYIWIMIPDCRAGIESQPLVSTKEYPADFLTGLVRIIENYRRPFAPDTRDPADATIYQTEVDARFPQLPNSRFSMTTPIHSTKTWRMLQIGIRCTRMVPSQFS